MKTVFMGTPQFAVPIMQALAQSDKIELAAVFTQPDSVSKRGKKVVPSAVKVAACELGVPVHTPETLRAPEAGALVESLQPDVIVVASYGKILTQRVLDAPRLGCINVHASLLPRWRGAAPIERAILAGDELTGISIMRMDEGLDTGDYCMQRVVQIGSMGTEELTRALSELGRDSIVAALLAIERGDAKWIEQDNSKSTYAEKVDKAEMMLTPELDALDNVLRVRASTDHAPARAVVCGRPMAIADARVFDALAAGVELDGAGAGVGASVGASPAPGMAARVRKRLLLGCQDGTCMEVLQVKPDGKKLMAASDFCAGVHDILKSGEATWEAL